MRKKYLDNLSSNTKRLVFVMDNCSAHKTHEVVKIMSKARKFCKVLLVPSNSPQFSPIENMFGRTKAKLRDREFKGKIELACIVSEVMFSFS